MTDLDHIRARHVPVPHSPDFCRDDGKRWPCDTAILLDRITNEPPLTAERHPGEPHEFRTTCLRCGEPGMLHVSLITPGEEVTIAALTSEEPTP